MGPRCSTPNGATVRKWLRHGHGCIPIRISMITDVPPITIVTSVKSWRQCDVVPRKGVTCRRACESLRYRWRRRPLSDCALRSASPHQRPPSLARAPPPPRSLPQPLLRRRTCPRRPIADQSGNDPPTPMRMPPSPGSVSSRRGCSAHFLHAPRNSSSKRRWRLRPLPPAPPTNSPPRRRCQTRPRLRRPRRLGHRSWAG
jgi:hypothetical protein